MKDEQCEFCEGEVKQRRVLTRFRFEGQTIYVENVPAWVCDRCGEQYNDHSSGRQRDYCQRHWRQSGIR